MVDVRVGSPVRGKDFFDRGREQILLWQLRYLLGVLQSDGYLVEVDGKYRFRSSMLRDFWLRRFGPGKSQGPSPRKAG